MHLLESRGYISEDEDNRYNTHAVLRPSGVDIGQSSGDLQFVT